MPSGEQKNKPPTVKEYIRAFPPESRKILNALHKLILDTVPGAAESIAYGMPAYKLKGKPLVYFAAFDKHIGLYATPSAHVHFRTALTGYKTGKGSVQFPLNQPIPWALVREMVVFKAEEILNRQS